MDAAVHTDTYTRSTNAVSPPSCTNMDTQALTQTDTIHTQTQTHRHIDTHTHTHTTRGSLVHHTTHMHTLRHAMYVLFYDYTHRQSVT